MSCVICHNSDEIWLVQACKCKCMCCFSCIKSHPECPVCKAKFSEVPVKPLERSFKWLYEGRNNGWWFYGPDMQHELELAYRQNRKTLSWYTCGVTLNIDMVEMLQTNPDSDGVRRIIRLEDGGPTPTYLIKGIGGLQTKNER